MGWFNKNKSSKNEKFNFDRLLQVNSKDPSIFTTSSINNLIDLNNVVEHHDLYNFLFTNKNELLIDNKNFSENLLKEVKQINSLDELVKFSQNNGIILTDSEISKLNKNFKLNKTQIITNKLSKELVSLSKRINQINLNNKKNLVDENIYTLYLGSYFLKGKINDTYINAPLLLYRVEIVIKTNNIFIKKIDPNPILNEKLNFLLTKQWKIKFDFSDDLNAKNILDYKNYLKGLCSNIDNSFNSNFINFNDDNNEVISIQNFVCLMLIEPTGGIIKKNIEEILNKKINPFEVNTKVDNVDEYESEIINNDDVIEINRKLNIYQKYVIKSALYQNTLIYGPPGTGKSEVLASIIANIIYKYNSKSLNILISSEKRVALEVIYKRIGKLNKLSLFISDTNVNEFYDQLKQYEEAIRRTIKKPDFSFANKQYEAILDSYKNLNSLLETKLNNNISFNAFLDSMSDMNFLEYSKYASNGDLNLINSILKKQKISIEGFIVFVDKFKELTKDYKNEMNILIMHKNFDSFDSHFLNEFLIKYDQSSKQDFIISSLITKNKIVTKKPLLGGTQKLILDVDQTKMINLIKALVELNINALTRDEVILINSLNIDAETLDKFLTYDNFINNIRKNKYVKQNSINQLFNEYTNQRNLVNKINDDLIYDYFMYKKCTEINKLNENQKAKIFELFGLCYLKNKPNINFVIKKYFNELKYLFPIWFASPEQVCSLIPNERYLFDYGIFDEASQMFVEKAFPLVYRCKVKIVAGDDKQLQPSSFFMKKLDNDNFDNQINTESLFEIANVCLWTKFYLRNHYRSKSAELIKFSNEYFYENKLKFSTYNGFNLKPIVVYNANGVWEENHNNAEIQKVIDILVKNKYLVNKKILIISFNSIQSKLIMEAFNNQFSKSKVWLDKMQDESIEFCALEEVQGNEADVVILSTSFAKDKENKFRQFFGPLSQANGQNRLNVAITRAKEQMFIVKSISGGDIKLSENESNNIFKYYLTYCDQFIETPKVFDKNKKTNFSNEQQNESFEFVNEKILNNVVEFIKTLKDFNNSDKYTIIKNNIVGNKMLDICVIDKNINKVIFALKINNNHNLDLKTNIQFLDEVQFLNDLDYPIYTFNVIDWFIKNKLIQQEIIAKINE